jgi:hypothetical protein
MKPGEGLSGYAALSIRRCHWIAPPGPVYAGSGAVAGTPYNGVPRRIRLSLLHLMAAELIAQRRQQFVRERFGIARLQSLQ